MLNLTLHTKPFEVSFDEMKKFVYPTFSCVPAAKKIHLLCADSDGTHSTCRLHQCHWILATKRIRRKGFVTTDITLVLRFAVTRCS